MFYFPNIIYYILQSAYQNIGRAAWRKHPGEPPHCQPPLAQTSLGHSPNPSPHPTTGTRTLQHTPAICIPPAALQSNVFWRGGSTRDHQLSGGQSRKSMNTEACPLSPLPTHDLMGRRLICTRNGRKTPSTGQNSWKEFLMQWRQKQVAGKDRALQVFNL